MPAKCGMKVCSEVRILRCFLRNDEMREIIEFDKQLFLEINRLHAEYLDSVMLFFSSYYSWVAIVCLILVWMLRLKDRSWRMPIIAFSFLSVISCNLLNQIVKVIVARPRPIHEEIFSDVIHAIEKYDASYSFFSAHSSTSFAIAVFALLVVRKAYFTASVLLWASVVAYSRIYLGKHYPLDVVVGILFGTIIAIICWRLFNVYLKRKSITDNKEIG